MCGTEVVPERIDPVCIGPSARSERARMQPMALPWAPMYRAFGPLNVVRTPEIR